MTNDPLKKIKTSAARGLVEGLMRGMMTEKTEATVDAAEAYRVIRRYLATCDDDDRAQMIATLRGIIDEHKPKKRTARVIDVK